MSKARAIAVGDTTVELSQTEIRLRAVAYLFKVRPDGPAFRRYASPEDVLSNIAWEHAFQVSPGGYEVMKAKAERLMAMEYEA